jgi:hypothetical protein
MGPYIAAKAVFDLPYLYGPTLLILILYLMTGTTGIKHSSLIITLQSTLVSSLMSAHSK